MAELNFPDPALENPWVDPSGQSWDHDGDGWIRSESNTGYPPADGALYGKANESWLLIDVLEAPTDGADYLRGLAGWQLLAAPPAQGLTQPGEMFWFAGSTAPVGSLACDGQELSQTTYDKLYAAIGSLWNTTGGVAAPGAGNFRAPPQELSSRGLYYRYGDPVGDSQGYQNEQHTHNATHNHTGDTSSDGAHSHTIGMGDTLVTETNGSPVVDDFGSGSSSDPVSSAGDHGHNLTIDNVSFSTGSNGGNEAIPSSVVMLRCIWTGDL